MPSNFGDAPDQHGETFTVSYSNAEEVNDPVLDQFLALLEQDCVKGENITTLPVMLDRILNQALKQPVDLSEYIEGEVNL
jgi:hypothetical protein